MGTEDATKAGETAFDTLIEKMKHEIDSAPDGAAREGHVAHLRALFEAALSEAQETGEGAIGRVRAEAGKIRDQMKAHPMTTISGAFAAGYLVGKTIAGKAGK